MYKIFRIKQYGQTTYELRRVVPSWFSWIPFLASFEVMARDPEVSNIRALRDTLSQSTLEEVEVE
jgi:hypothetical protein